MLAGKDEAVPQEMLPEVAACLLGCLADRCSSKSALPLDRPSSRYFYTLLRTLQAAVSQVRGWHHIHSVIPALVSKHDMETLALVSTRRAIALCCNTGVWVR